MWLMGQEVGGGSFAFIVGDSLELTRANIAALADDAADRAYWADESAIAVLQRYLHTRLLIFNPTADERNRCACVGDVGGGGAAGSSGGGESALRFVLLKHTHRTSKDQHYELYAKPGEPHMAAFERESLPAGVRRAFADVCPEADASWRAASDPEA
jgi:hypothetical protein